MSTPKSVQRPLSMRLWYSVLKWGLQMAGVMGYGVRFTGRQNVPKEGGVLVVSNHQSHFDPPLVGLGCPRRMNYLARKTLFDSTLLGPLIHSLDAIPINRDGLGLGGIKETLRRLKRGEMVLMFPEGTRSPDGEIGVFRPGFTTLAVRSGAVILPVGIEGAYDAWPKSQDYPNLLRPIHVHFGTPMTHDEIRQFPERELIAEVRRRVSACHELVRRHPNFARRPQPGG